MAKFGNRKSRNKRKFGVIVGSGSCNPLTRMHMRMFYLAKQYLESRSDIFILGSLLSPSHGSAVRERYRTNTSEIIPSPHRLAIAQLLVSDSKWLAIDPWEITRKRSMDYLSLLEHSQELIRTHTSQKSNYNLSDYDVKIFYLCKASMVPLLSAS